MALGKRIETIEEVALPLQGKKRGLTRKSWIQYYGRDRLALTDKIIDKILTGFHESGQTLRNRISESFLPDEQKELYDELLFGRLSLFDSP